MSTTTSVGASSAPSTSSIRLTACSPPLQKRSSSPPRYGSRLSTKWKASSRARSSQNRSTRVSVTVQTLRVPGGLGRPGPRPAQVADRLPQQRTFGPPGQGGGYYHVRRQLDDSPRRRGRAAVAKCQALRHDRCGGHGCGRDCPSHVRSEEHTSELQSLAYLVCR